MLSVTNSTSFTDESSVTLPTEWTMKQQMTSVVMTTVTGISKQTEKVCLWYRFAVAGVLMSTVGVLGILGNILGLLVLRRMWLVSTSSTQRCMYLLLALLTLYDLSFLICMVTVTAVPTICSFSDICGNFFSVAYPYMLVWGWPLVSLFSCHSIWCTVVVGFHRYVAVCRPHQLRTVCTWAKTRWIAFITFLAVTIYEIPLFLDDYLVKELEPDGSKRFVRKYTDLGSSDLYQLIYKTSLSYIVLFILPFILLAFFTVNLLLSLRRSTQMREKYTHDTSGDKTDGSQNHTDDKKSTPGYDSLTRMLLVILLVFFLTQPLEPFRRIMENFYGFDTSCGHAFFYVAEWLKPIGAFNSACNFYVFCFFSDKMWQVTKSVILCRRDELMNESSETGTCNTEIDTRTKPIAHNNIWGISTLSWF